MAKWLTQTSDTQAYREVLQDVIPRQTPFIIFTEPAGNCNQRCTCCPQTFRPEKLIKDILSVDSWNKLIKDISSFKDPLKVLRICGMGEPLLNKNIIEMCRIAKQADYIQRIELVTNGTLLTMDMAKVLPKYLWRIIISIGSLLDMQILETLYKNKNSCIIYIKGFKGIMSEEQFEEAYGHICDELYLEFPVPQWPEIHEISHDVPSRWDDRPIIPRKICSQVFKGPQVLSNGDVVPCCVDYARWNILGNVIKNSISDIWKGETLRNLQIAHLEGKKSELIPCKECYMNDYCEYDNIDNYAEEILERYKGGGYGRSKMDQWQ